MSQINRDNFEKRFNKDGYVIVENVFSTEIINQLKDAVQESIKIQKESLSSNANRYIGKLICTPMYANEFPVFLDLLTYNNQEWLKPFNWMLGEYYIAYIYATSSLPPNNDIDSQYIHVDIPRYIPNYISSVGAIINLDDFTEENGGTLLLKGSQHDLEKPDWNYFQQNADKFIAKAGSICYFDMRVWHGAGQNNSNNWRNSIVVAFCKPWMKQWVDIPRLMQNNNVEIDKINPSVLQLLGFYAQPPDNIHEFSMPIEQRMFSQKVV